MVKQPSPGQPWGSAVSAFGCPDAAFGGIAPPWSPRVYPSFRGSFNDSGRVTAHSEAILSVVKLGYRNVLPLG